MVLPQGLTGFMCLEKNPPGPVQCGTMVPSAKVHQSQPSWFAHRDIECFVRAGRVERFVMIRFSVPTYSRSISQPGCEVGIGSTCFYHQFMGLELLNDP